MPATPPRSLTSEHPNEASCFRIFDFFFEPWQKRIGVK